MLKIAGSYQLEAPIEAVWPRIFDPQSLMNLIPGCQQIEQITPDEYRGHIRVGIAAVSGAYQTYVKVIQRDPPHHCRFAGEVSGPTGIITGEAAFTLQEVTAHASRIEYQAQAMITGALAQLNSRFVEGIARTLINHGLANLNKQLSV
jgi:carbon monoxide dehydrogenase subunit G